MAFTKDDFMKLLRLQEADARRDSLTESIDKVPVEIEGMRSRIENEKGRLSGIQEKMKKVKVDRSTREKEMAEKEELIKKHQKELNAVKSNEAFKALLKEIDQEKQSVSDLETEILTLMDEADKVVKEEKSLNAELKAFESECQGKIKELEAKKAELEKKREEIEAKRKGLAEAVPEDLLASYESTRERRGLALARVEGKTCGACNMMLPPQVLIDIKKCSEIQVCDSCHRILHELELPEPAPAQSE